MTAKYVERGTKGFPSHGRRKDDGTCAMHDFLQDETKAHRKVVCDKIAGKADNKDLKGMIKFVSILVTICCLVMAGMAAWLKMDLSKVDDKIENGFSTTHRRITDNATIREINDKEQLERLQRINGQFDVITYRISRIEDEIKEAKTPQHK